MACPLAVPRLAGQFIKSLTRIRNSVVFKNERKKKQKHIEQNQTTQITKASNMFNVFKTLCLLFSVAL